jgi:hypothetical protein
MPEQHELPNGSMLYLECIPGFPELVGDGGDAVPDFFEHLAASAPGAPSRLDCAFRKHGRCRQGRLAGLREDEGENEKTTLPTGGKDRRAENV